MQATKSISLGAKGSNPITKGGILVDFEDPALHRSSSGAYPADE
jgi:hypothetical protein